MGDALSSLNVKELKQLENRLERSITRIRSKKQLSIVEAGAEYDAIPAFDSRSYYHPNILEAAAQLSHHQDQTALQLGYETKADSAA
ncbi:hypothetical protein GW17_00055904 [Ensete ventricosum]|nr:hypothetical protein GW17_00055904 [Ensete ventricosum]RZS20817.1 hypothetical protein BHM03_00053383 [Ensete ventricosum]